ncbi:hypothetical protein ECG_08983 [Echinococcus granulosus]|nr:hypothetical protein ECG_08983 [Echinococcus granulosus]
MLASKREMGNYRVTEGSLSRPLCLEASENGIFAYSSAPTPWQHMSTHPRNVYPDNADGDEGDANDDDDDDDDDGDDDDDDDEGEEENAVLA